MKGVFIYNKNKTDREIPKARDRENGEEGMNPETWKKRRRIQHGFWRDRPWE